MTDSTRYVGLDVHAKTIAIAVAEEGRAEPRYHSRVTNDLSRVLKALDRLGPRASLHCAYKPDRRATDCSANSSEPGSVAM